ncbi:hypothetical protein [Massilia sp. Root335]|uniref:hypothetical protein n=1 Tax=Massilia sp. Root335 TaxID=1736517 RepID=UPI0006FBE418|nr:hypothetical protein [Massilia sp. Root335]KQV43238.1 hypothetical protein ASC93_15710 [Massilia sp. Root335]
MLSKEQAHAIADALLDEARAARPRLYRAASTPVHWLYRCRALRSVPEVLQAEVVRQAKKETMFNPWFDILALISILAPWVTWAIKPTVLGKSGFGTPIVALSPLLILTVQTMLIRRAIKMIARQLGESVTADA